MDSNSAMFVMFARKPFFLLTYCKTVPWNVNCNAPSLVCKSVVMKKFVVVHNVHPVLPPQCSFDERVDSLSRLVLPVHLDMTTQRQLNYDMLATQASFNSFIPPTYISLMLKLYIQLSEICQHLRLSEWSMSSETRHSTACCWITIQHAEAQNNSTASCEYDRIREAIVRLWHRMKLSLVKLLIVTIETSLDREDESRNFFSRSRIKFLKVRYREMTLGHTQCAWTTQSIWLPHCGWPAGIPGKTAATAFEVWCRGWPAPALSFMMRCLSSEGNCSCVHCLLHWHQWPSFSALHLSHGFQCSPTLNRQPYEGRLPLTSWWRKSSNMTVGQSRLIYLAHHCYDWHPGSRCG